MRVMVQGVGGIGGIIGASLVEAGYDVLSVTGNPAISEALNTHGFRVQSESGHRTVKLRSRAYAEVPEGEPGVDMVLLATQSTMLESALKRSLPLLRTDGVVVCLQNGLPEDRAAAVVGEDRVLGCVVGWGGSMIAPGEYVRTSAGGFQLGYLPATSRTAVEKAGEVLQHVAPVKLTDNLSGVRWSKLALNSAITTLGAAGGQHLGALMRHRFVRRLALEIFTEVVAVARSQNVRLEKVNGTLDMEQIALKSEEKMSSFGTASLLLKHTLLLGVGLKYRRLRSSMLYALERGRPVEVELLNGEVVRRGKALGVETPVNLRLTELIHDIAAGRRTSSLDLLREVHHEVVQGASSARA